MNTSADLLACAHICRFTQSSFFNVSIYLLSLPIINNNFEYRYKDTFSRIKKQEFELCWNLRVSSLGITTAELLQGVFDHMARFITVFKGRLIKNFKVKFALTSSGVNNESHTIASYYSNWSRKPNVVLLHHEGSGPVMCCR